MDKRLVKELLDGALDLNPDLFLVEFEIKEGNKIYVEVDGDKGVSLEECIRISRAIEHNLDREEDDFSLEVTTPDIARPLKLARQYKKNIGRTLKVKTNEEEYEGELESIEDDIIKLYWKSREPKPIGKGKITVENRKEISLGDIIEAKVKIKFN